MATIRKAAKEATPAAKKAVKASKKAAPARKPAPSSVAKAAPAPVKTAPIAKAAAAPKADKPKKPKLVRDSFTIPKAEYLVLEELKQRAARLGRPAKKSEVLRAGIKALSAMGDSVFLASLGAVPAIKTGRPAKD